MNPFQDLAGQAQAAFARGDMVEAERLFRAALIHKPRSPGATRALGITLIQQGKFQDAEEVWLQAVEIEPQAADNHNLLAGIYMANAKLALAETHYKRALEIKPDLPAVAFKLAQINHLNRKYVAAADYYVRAHGQSPFEIEPLKGAVQALMESGQATRAAVLAQEGLERLRLHGEVAPNDVTALTMILAEVHKALGDVARAADCYRTVIAADPGNEVARHYLAAAENRVTHEHAQAFARDIFDAMAPTFDSRLVGMLGYRSPRVLATGLREVAAGARGFARVLDLGCGTGLMIAALKELFDVPHAVGVDLSPNMVQEAQKRGVYAELICGDVVDTMKKSPELFDLIVAADVFIYVGELSKVFGQAKARLAPTGLFAFTTEIGEADVELAAHGHYRHGKAYIAQLAAQNGFTVLQTADAPIRQERGGDVMGHYVYLRA